MFHINTPLLEILYLQLVDLFQVSCSKILKTLLDTDERLSEKVRKMLQEQPHYKLYALKLPYLKYSSYVYVQYRLRVEKLNNSNYVLYY